MGPSRVLEKKSSKRRGHVFFAEVSVSKTDIRTPTKSDPTYHERLTVFPRLPLSCRVTCPYVDPMTLEWANPEKCACYRIKNDSIMLDRLYCQGPVPLDIEVTHPSRHEHANDFLVHVFLTGCSSAGTEPFTFCSHRAALSKNRKRTLTGQELGYIIRMEVTFT